MGTEDFVKSRIIGKFADKKKVRDTSNEVHVAEQI